MERITLETEKDGRIYGKGNVELNPITQHQKAYEFCRNKLYVDNKKKQIMTQDKLN